MCDFLVRCRPEGIDCPASAVGASGEKIENLDAFSSRIPPKNRPIAYNSEIYKEMLEIQWKSYKSQIYKEIGLLQNISFQIYKEIGLRQNITFQIYKEIGNLQNRRFAYNFSNL